MDIQYSSKAEKQLQKIYKGDKKSALMILEIIERYADNPNGNFDIKPLKGNYGEFKRLRVGNYRIIFDDEDNVLSIYEIKHRQGAYDD